VQWFLDVRNPEHPYYAKYKEIMKHPIFAHPKVSLWSGNRDSSLGTHPLIKEEEIRKAVDFILTKSDFIELLSKYLGKCASTEICVYGIGILGKLLIRLIKLNDSRLHIEKIYDKFSNLKEWDGIPVERPVGICNKTIIVTTYGKFDEIAKELEEISENRGGDFQFV
jgi:DNA mismatch repair ATPase MutS